MLQNKITNSFIENLIDNIMFDNKTELVKILRKQDRDILESKVSFILDVLEIPNLEIDICNMKDVILQILVDKLLTEIFKYEDIKTQLLRRYIQHVISSNVAVNVKEEDLESFCKILSYSVFEYDYFRLL